MRNSFFVVVNITIILFGFYVDNAESIIEDGIETKMGKKPLWNETHVDKLKKDLLTNYDRYTRPENHNNVTKVKIGMSVIHVETDEHKSQLKVFSWMRMAWFDSKLKWNARDYGNISVLRIANHEIWQPGMFLFNSVSGAEEIGRYGNHNILVYPNGEVLWVPSVELNSLCEFNLRHWPFDTQNCSLSFGSWVYSDDELNISLIAKETSAEVEPTIAASAWKVDVTAKIHTTRYNCCVETYSVAIFNLTLVRKSSPYYSLAVTPAVVATFLILLQFWLPTHAGERILLNGFTIMILNLFFLYLNHQVSATGKQTPLIVLFYSSSLYIVGFSMIWSIAGFSLCRIQKRKSLPQWIKRLVQGKLGEWLFLNQYSRQVHHRDSSPNNETAEEIRDHGVSDIGNSIVIDSLKKLVQLEWLVVFVAIDRIFFVIYSILFIILAIVFS